MKRLSLAFLAAALIAVMSASCSQDDLLNSPGGSYPTTMPLSAPFSSVGPSEIVICIDVSDSISADELVSMVDGLKGTLSDPSIVPQGGEVTVSALVYGDTIALSFSPAPVRADNLTNIIVPALDSLLVDRLVGGTGFDMTWALQYAGAMLGVSTVADQHILLIGSGAANDPAGVNAACQELQLLGIMVSTVGVAPDGNGAALLESCATMTGGFFGAGDADIGALTDEALAYMLHVDIYAEPEFQERLLGEDHTVTVNIFRGWDPEKYPLEGIVVDFEVLSGPNQAESATDTTDAGGIAGFTFNGDGGSGTDTIATHALHPGTGSIMLDIVTVTWLNTPPVCDAGGPYDVSVDSDTATVNLDATGSIDSDEDSLMFSWKSYCEEVSFDDATSATPILTITGDCLCVDSFAVEVMVTDGYDSTTCTAAVNIDDQRPPVIVVREEPLVMWPPNHKYKTITTEMLLESAEDACGNPIDLSGAVVLAVRSDEPEDHKGDGKTLNDIIVLCPNLVKLRSERMGGGNGRVYTILFRITAENGVSADAEAKVIVPHDNSGPSAIEDVCGGYEVIPACGN